MYTVYYCTIYIQKKTKISSVNLGHTITKIVRINSNSCYCFRCLRVLINSFLTVNTYENIKSTVPSIPVCAFSIASSLPCSSLQKSAPLPLAKTWPFTVSLTAFISSTTSLFWTIFWLTIESRAISGDKTYFSAVFFIFKYGSASLHNPDATTLHTHDPIFFETNNASSRTNSFP